ncbi:protein unc-13 homolog isoform X2 [Rhododendron vialii]|uniref:protein unc-13 homolog isoform X2 n=1 Tax=Rhododendron vialii TaxID=182163 RepID=UPI00265DD46B|nr:protein unc-13 homolog isoform X2 [Rhododendron vialii]
MGISNDKTTIPAPPSDDDDLPNPFAAQLGLPLSDLELRETAYEVLVASCRSTGANPLTYISQSQRSPPKSATPKKSTTEKSSSNTLGLRKSAAVKKGRDLSGQDAGKAKRPVTVPDLVRVQMGISEHADSRIRRGLLRIAVAQVGKRIETMVLPLELLQQFKHTDFPNQLDFEAWQKRKLKILEAGLLLHPHLPLDKNDTAPQRLKKLISGALEKPIETGKQSEKMKGLRTTVMSLACRSFDGSVSETCHWADGVPLNLCLYQMFLEACFDADEKTSVVEEVDEVLDLVKKTWVVLGINQMLHNLCFSWVLFHRYISTGQVETNLLFAANSLLVEVEKDAKATMNAACSSILSSTLNLILGWTEKSLLSYHDTFYSDNIDVMPIFVSLAVLAAKILEKDISSGKEVDVARDRVDMYIRSSVHSAFSQAMEMIKSSKKSSKNQRNPLPVLSILAQYIIEVALNEKEIFSPILKRWHPLAAGAAVAVLHACYGNELKRFVKIAGIGELSPNVVLVLYAADKLERVLVQIAVEDSVESEDGGKAVIQEMTPFESEGVMDSLVKTWIGTRVDRLRELVGRNLQEEDWDPEAYKERYAPSAGDVLRMMDETVEAFFLLPMTRHRALLPDLMGGLDQCLQQYIMEAKSGCGSRNTFIPVMPALTRCKTGSKLPVAFKRKENSYAAQGRKPQLGTTDGENSLGLPQQCVRINTMQHIRVELEVLVKRIINRLNSKSSSPEDISQGIGKKFELSIAACVEGLQQLCEATAYKVIFHDLSRVLWDGLYVGEVALSRIEPFLEELEQHLEIILATAHDRVRTRLIIEVMKASFEGFLFVLLAGGPSRAFTRQDSDTLEEDFMFLMDLFWFNGDGLPSELIIKASTTVKGVIPLFRIPTESLIDQFRRITQDTYGLSAKSKLPLPPTSGKWDPTDPNTLLRVLCHRNDDMASNFLKKTYNLPKEVIQVQVPELKLPYDSMLG